MPRHNTARAPVREAPVRQEAEREPVRAKVRTRKGVGTDEFHIPQDMIPAGIDLQWNVDSILGQPAPQARTRMERQAWEPVLPGMWDGRFDGMFTPKGHKGEINVGGLVLMWRPIELTMEARAEELGAARNARNVEERKIQAGAPDGVDPGILTNNQPTARANTFIRKERIPSMPVPQ